MFATPSLKINATGMNFGFSFKIRWTIVGLVITTQHIITIILCTIACTKYPINIVLVVYLCSMRMNVMDKYGIIFFDLVWIFKYFLNTSLLDTTKHKPFCDLRNIIMRILFIFENYSAFTTNICSRKYLSLEQK